MKPANVIPMAVPAIGQQQFDARQAVKKQCECGCELFDKAVKVELISRMAMGNMTRKDVIIETAVYMCRSCGKSLDMLSEAEKPDVVDETSNKTSR